MKILVIDDEQSIRDGLSMTLTRRRHEVTTASDGLQGLEEFKTGGYDLVFLDMKMPGIDGIETLAQLRAFDPLVEAVIITGYPSIDSVIQAFRQGARDFLPKPFSTQEVRIITNRVEERRRLNLENEKLRRQLKSVTGEDFVRSVSPAMREVDHLIEKVAATNSTVLLTGESGTGKEVAARAITALSDRAGRELVTVDCSTLAETLLESELFGHVKGSFTGAGERKRGLLELADNGTLFLDEVGNLTQSIQAKLLRVVQEGEFKPVGADFVRKVDIRIISATNADLKKAVEAGTFREDLYYRLAVFPIHLPPLRERSEDVPELVNHFARKFAAQAGKKLKGVAPEFHSATLGYEFPGNIRELANIVQRAVILEEGEELTTAGLAPHIAGGCAPTVGFPTLREIEKEHIRRALVHHAGQKATAAQALGIDRKTLYRKIVEYGLE